MIKELAYFVRYGPRIGRMRGAMGRAEFLAWLSKEIDGTKLGALRQELVDGLHGDILEIGTGSGALFHRYGEEVRLTAIEPDEEFRALAEQAARDATPPIQVLPGTAEALPVGDDSVDAAVASMVLCSVRSVSGTLAEFMRVLKPGGRLRLLEHVRSDRPVVGALMDALNPVWLRLNQMGCNWNRRTVAAVREAGFRIEFVAEYQVFDPAVPAAFPWRLIKAVKP